MGMVRKTVVIITSFLVIIFLLALPAHSAVSDWDDTFGGDGLVWDPGLDGGGEDTGDALAVQADGKIVVAGQTTDGVDTYMALWRFNTSGALDTGFGGTGLVVNTGAAGDTSDRGYGLAIQEDGKILVTGDGFTGSDFDMVLWRVLVSGTLDSSFGDGTCSNGVGPGGVMGCVVHDNAAGGSGADQGSAVAVQQDGKTVVVGTSLAAGINAYDMAVWRYTAEGELDTTFNGQGYFTHGNAGGGNSGDRGYGVSIQSSGKIVVAGFSTIPGGFEDMVTWRLTSAGVLDTSFSDDGYVTHSLAGDETRSLANGVVTQQDGAILVVGYITTPATEQDIAVWRYLTNGTLDTTFGTSGVSKFHNIAGGGQYDYGQAIVLQAGKPVIAGFSFAGGDNDADDMVIVRLTTEGGLDDTFNVTGYVTYNGFGGEEGYNWDYGFGLAAGENGCVYVAGAAYETGDESGDLALWKYCSVYQVANLDAALNAVDDEANNVEVGTLNGLVGENDVRIQNTEGKVIADVQVDFTDDLDWSGVSGTTDFVNRKSFVHDLVNAPGFQDTFTLYVPKAPTDNAIGICVGATSLAEVNDQCTGYISFSEEEFGSNIVTINGDTYWKVQFLVGTGGFSFRQLGETGHPGFVPVILGGIFTTLGVLTSRKRNPFTR